MAGKCNTKKPSVVHSSARTGSIRNDNALFEGDKSNIDRISASPTNVMFERRADLTSGLSEAMAIVRAGSHKSRCIILFRLAQGASPIEDLEELLLTSRAVVTVHLSRLRMEGIVDATRVGEVTYYSLRDDRMRRFLWRIGRLVFTAS